MRRIRLAACAALVALALVPHLQSRAQETGSSRPRSRELGIQPGVFQPGTLNAITDVAGVTVGHVTLVEGDRVRTGVTAILPHQGNLFQDKVAGAVFVGNAFGKLAGSTQVEELGTIETPIVLTNTLAVGAGLQALVAYTLGQPGNERVQSVNGVVGETNDGGLNDIRGAHVTPDHVLAAIRNATGGRVAEGSVGAGTGTRCFGWKGGIGTASRVLPARYGGYTLGVLVQSNFGGVLTVDGAPVGRELGNANQKVGATPEGKVGATPEGKVGATPAGKVGATPAGKVGATPEGKVNATPEGKVGATFDGDGSCMIVVATDAPVDARDLKRIAARAVFGLARTGSSYSNGSGDYAIAFSTAPELRTRFAEAAPRARHILPPDGVSPLFQAALEATEEAVYNSLLQATTVTSRSGSAEAIPIEKVREVLRRYGRTQ